MTTGVLPPEQYYATLPKSITGAGAIFHDPAERILLVQPTYGEKWEIPGGGLDAGEFPAQAATREVTEETSMSVRLGRLLVVDWVPPQPDGRPALSNFLFDAGTLTEADARDRIQLPADELRQWRLAGPDEWPDLLDAHMVRRLHACAWALRTGTTAYLHHGHHPAELGGPGPDGPGTGVPGLPTGVLAGTS